MKHKNMAITKWYRYRIPLPWALNSPDHLLVTSWPTFSKKAGPTQELCPFSLVWHSGVPGPGARATAVKSSSAHHRLRGKFLNFQVLLWQKMVYLSPRVAVSVNVFSRGCSAASLPPWQWAGLQAWPCRQPFPDTALHFLLFLIAVILTSLCLDPTPSGAVQVLFPYDNYDSVSH